MPCVHASGVMGTMLTAHSVIRDPDGTLYDITLLGDESIRASLRFVPHDGTGEEFRQWEISNRCICCSAEWGAGLPEDAKFDPNSDSSWLVDDTKDFFSADD
jgi:hypothetical protein